MIGERNPRRASVTFLRIVLGLVLGPVAVWVLVDALPIQSGRAVVATSVAITLFAAVGVWALVREMRAAAIAFALGSAATGLLLLLVVAS